jgi:UDP-N-acetyl-2-amino-2-deoxyglucuronate dehydrogenase
MTTDRPKQRPLHALIGCGRIAPHHVDAFANIDEIVLGIACDRIPSVVGDFAEKHGIAETSTDHREVFADSRITSVSIATDHGQHGTLVRQALLAGKHVLVEKPLSLDISDAEELVALADSLGLALSVVSQHRYDHIAVGVHSLIQTGRFGRLLSLNASLECGRDKDYYASSYWHGTIAHEGGSALINQAYHCMDLLHWLGGDVTSINAIAETLALGGTIETEDTLASILQFRNGALGSLVVTSVAHSFWRSRIEVIGTGGTLAFSIDSPPKILHLSGTDDLMTAAETLQSDSPADTVVDGIQYYGMSHRRQVADFCASIRDRRQPIASGVEGVETLRTILAAYRSAETRTTQYLTASHYATRSES